MEYDHLGTKPNHQFSGKTTCVLAFEADGVSWVETWCDTLLASAFACGYTSIEKVKCAKHCALDAMAVAFGWL